LLENFLSIARELSDRNKVWEPETKFGSWKQSDRNKVWELETIRSKKVCKRVL